MPKTFFDNTAIAFKSKSNFQLRKARMLFWLMGNPVWNKIASSIAKIGISLRLPIKWIIKNTIYAQFCGGETIQETVLAAKKLKQQNVHSILDYSVEGQENEESLNHTKSKLQEAVLTAKNEESIFCACLKVTGLSSNTLLEKISTKQELTQQEKNAYSKVKERLNEICKAAHEAKTPVYIDAEETWLQPAIDDLCEELMLTYNKVWPCVYTTFQMYRSDKLEQLNDLIEFAKKHNFIAGVKLVRGAYLEKETERSKRIGYPNPMQPTKEHTDKDYDNAVQNCLNNINHIAICLGTHNELSCLKAVELMESYNIKKDHEHIWFSQLYGMSDHMSFILADRGYNVSKYLPFGPIKHTLPYLIRRADENTSIQGQMSKELRLYIKELRRRNFTKKVNKFCRKPNQ